MGLRERKKRPQVGQTMASVTLGSPEEFGGARFMQSSNAGFPGSRYYYNYYAQPSPYLGSPEEAPPVLMRGSTGRWVVYLQGRLGLAQTGVFGVVEEASVKQVQAMTGLAQTGMTDVATWAAIARLPPGFGLGQLAAPYGSYSPYPGGYGPTYYGFQYYPWWGTFRNPSRGGTSSSDGGGRSSGMSGGGQ